MELSLSEEREWKVIRNRIKENVGTVWAVFEDLRRVRDARLYRVDFKSFDEFVRVDLGYTAKYAHRMIQALGTKELVDSVDIPDASQIDNERKLRELSGLPQKEIAEVINEASAIAGDEPITHRHLKQARERVAPRETIRAVVNDDEGREVPDHLRRAHANGAMLKQIAKKIAGLGAELKKVAEMPGGECVDVDKVCASLSSVGNAVSLSAYGATCDRCGGDGCDSCGQRGWFPQRNVKRD